jgi:hypothetical protein
VVVVKGYALRRELRLVICYWLFVSAIFFLDFKYMHSDWAGLPGFVVTLPLSVIVVTIGFLIGSIAGLLGHDMVVTDYYFEYGFIVCAFLNPFIFCPLYLLWKNRKRGKSFEPPPPPNGI